jgi:hypothetical protein
MPNPLHVLNGNGFLKVTGKDALKVTYNIEVFTDRATGTIISEEERNVSDFFGDQAILQLQDGQLWECIVVNKTGRLEPRGNGALPRIPQS